MAKTKSTAKKVRRPARPAARKPVKAKPAPKPAPKAAQAKRAATARPAKNARARTAPRPAPVRSAPAKAALAIPEVPAAQAPKKFRREYRKWKDLLIALRHRLLQEGSHLEEEGLKALEQEVSVDHMADFGSDSYEQETTLQLIESNSLTLRDVDDALRRIEQGVYGLCEECERLVPPARLGVLPHARYCIECQSRRESVAS